MNRILCKQRICRVSNGNVCMDEDKRHWGTVCYNFFTLDLKQHLIKIHSKSVLTTVVVVFWIHWTSYSKQQLQQLQIQRICNNFFFLQRIHILNVKILIVFKKCMWDNYRLARQSSILMLTGSFESKSDLNEL